MSIDKFNPPKASSVISAIQKLIDRHGDLPMYLDDPDTGWLLELGIEYKEREKVICFFSDYNGIKRGCVVDNEEE